MILIPDTDILLVIKPADSLQASLAIRCVTVLHDLLSPVQLVYPHKIH